MNLNRSQIQISHSSTAKIAILGSEHTTAQRSSQSDTNRPKRAFLWCVYFILGQAPRTVTPNGRRHGEISPKECPEEYSAKTREQDQRKHCCSFDVAYE